MCEHTIYGDIAKRTGGDIYIGVVGPVRTGKSTFIKRFMETTVLPNIKGEFDRSRATDEMPQSASGKTVMTTEPKFVPDEAVEVTMEDGATLKIKMIDCVGYIVPEAIGHEEDGKPRMVNTPWSEEPMPFEQAAEIGTRKVICEHSTIGMVVTTDGSIGEIPRESYVEVEERVIRELRDLKKPFAVILNSARPDSEEATALALSLEEKYGVPVALVNCTELDGRDIGNIMSMVLREFPISEVRLNLPTWVTGLNDAHPVKSEILSCLARCAASADKCGRIGEAFAPLSECEYISSVTGIRIDYGQGRAEITAEMFPDLYYRVLSELTGFDIGGEEDLVELLCKLSSMKERYDKVAAAVEEADRRGYGIVMPSIDEMKLEEPEIVKQAGGYGVKLRASAQSIHMIRANIETEINPVVGTEQQSEELIGYLLREFEENPRAIWESNMFGKSLYELMNEGLHNKLEHMPEQSRTKLSQTLERIINEGSNGLICIIL